MPFTFNIFLFLAGALVSKLVPDKHILFIFAMLALIAAAMMLIPRSYAMSLNKGLSGYFLSRPGEIFFS